VVGLGGLGLMGGQLSYEYMVMLGPHIAFDTDPRSVGPKDAVPLGFGVKSDPVFFLSPPIEL